MRRGSMFGAPNSAQYLQAITQMQNARARALYQYSRAQRLQTDAQRFAAAQKAYAEGKIDVAYRLFSRIAVARNTAPQTVKSRELVRQIQLQGETELLNLQAQFHSVVDSMSAAPSQSANRETAERQLVEWEQAFHEFSEKYGEVSRLENQITVFLRRAQKDHGAVLNEPEARRLLAQARALEQSDELCCAFYVYEQAAELRPAPSAEQAFERYQDLVRHASIVAAAETCRKLQWCHNAYSEAEELFEVEPKTAEGLYLKIVQRAPEDSTVYIAAKEQLAKLR